MFVSAGTFYSHEKLKDLFSFVHESLESDWQPFVLSEPTGQLKKEESTLNELGLVSISKTLNLDKPVGFM